MNIIHINDLDNRELNPYLTLRRPDQHWDQKIFVAEGEKVVIRLLGSSLTIRSLLLTQEWYDRLFTQESTHQKGYGDQCIPRVQDAKIFIAEKAIMEKIVGYRLHQGIMALASVPTEPELDEVMIALRKDSIITALDGLVNAENVGVIVRNCAAFGSDLIMVGETSSSPYLRRAVRNSMGAVFQIPVIHTENLRDSLKILRERFDTRIIAAYPQENSSLFLKKMSGKICIVFGNEDKGISKNILDICDEKISIPMMKDTDSLNVASASAVFLYEARKQRMLSLPEKP